VRRDDLGRVDARVDRVLARTEWLLPDPAVAGTHDRTELELRPRCVERGEADETFDHRDLALVHDEHRYEVDAHQERPVADQAVDLAPGVRLILDLQAVGEPDARGIRTVLVRVNGQLRPFDVRDLSVTTTEVVAERADPGNPGHVAAPYAGAVTVSVSEGDEIEPAQPVAVIEAMKMENEIVAPTGGVVERIVVREVTQVQPGDLLLVIRER